MAILSRTEVQAFLADAFETAIQVLRTRNDLPDELPQLVEKDDWAAELFQGTWAKKIASRPEFHEKMARYFEPLSDPQSKDSIWGYRALIMFADYVTCRFSAAHGLPELYHPWIHLVKPILPGEKVIIDYCWVEKVYLSPRQRLWEGLFGRLKTGIELPASDCAASHLRFRPPEGTQALHFEAERSEIIDECQIEPDYAHFYLPRQKAMSAFVDDEAPRFSVTTWITQTASMRFVTAALFGLVAFFPPILAAIGLLTEAKVELTLENSASLILSRGLIEVLRAVHPEHAVLASQLSLPLAIGIFASAWDRPAVRAFMVSQLMLAVAVLALWMTAGLWTHMTVAGFLAATCLFGYNVWDALTSLLKAPHLKKARHYSPVLADEEYGASLRSLVHDRTRAHVLSIDVRH